MIIIKVRKQSDFIALVTVITTIIFLFLKTIVLTVPNFLAIETFTKELLLFSFGLFIIFVTVLIIFIVRIAVAVGTFVS